MTLKLRSNCRNVQSHSLIAEGFKKIISLTHWKMGILSFHGLVFTCVMDYLIVVFINLFHHLNLINHQDPGVVGGEGEEVNVHIIPSEFDLFLKCNEFSGENIINAKEQIKKNTSMDPWELIIGPFLKVMFSEINTRPQLEIVGNQWKKSLKGMSLIFLLALYILRASTAYHFLDSGRAKINLPKDLKLFLSNGLSLVPIKDTLQICKTKSTNFMKSLDSNHWQRSCSTFNAPRVMTIQQIYCQRLASFRAFPLGNIPSCLSFIRLAESGFVYSGNGTNVSCVGCGREERVSEFERGGIMVDPEASMFHNTDCRFVKGELQDPQCNTSPGVFPEMAVQGDSLANTNRSHHGESAAQVQENVPVPAQISHSQISAGHVSAGQISAGQVSAGQVSAGQVSAGQVSAEQVSAGQVSAEQVSSDIMTSQTETRQASPLTQAQGQVQADLNTSMAEGRQENLTPLDVDSIGAASATRDSQTGAAALIDSVSDEENLWNSNFIPEHAVCENPDLKNSLPLHQINCDKNPGHFAYFPLKQLNLHQIPSAMRTEASVKFLKTLGDLTVRVKVSLDTKRNKPDRNNCSFGTGYVSLAEQTARVGVETGSHGKLDNLKKKMSSLVTKSKEYITIETNKHVVSGSEAALITVEFFFDHPNRRDVKVLKVVSVAHSDASWDNRSFLTCTTSDQPFLKKIHQTRQDVLELANRLPNRTKEFMTKKIFIIGHAHGYEKIVSYGDSVPVKYAIMQAEKDGVTERCLVKVNDHHQVTRSPEQMRKALLYAADTCSGSSGAPIVTFTRGAPDESGQPSYHLDLWMHNGIEKNIKLGASNLRGCSLEDIQPRQTENSNQNNTLNMNEEREDEDSSGNQVVTSPVFKVMSHPSYPVYIAYQKRLESLANWQYSHIHTREQLAHAGFFYAGYSDCVRCFQCGLGLRSWKPGDDVIEEHQKHRPTCPFLQAQLRSQENNLEISESNDLSPLPEIRRVTTCENNLHKDISSGVSYLPEKVSATETNLNMTKNMNLPAHLFNHVEVPQQVAAVNFVMGSNCAPAFNDNCDEVKLLRKENRMLNEQLLCKVCCKALIKDLFLPCGELYACSDCSKLLTHCPSCNKQILATVTTYFS